MHKSLLIPGATFLSAWIVEFLNENRKNLCDCNLKQNQKC